jgi:hypothetical protein
MELKMIRQIVLVVSIFAALQLNAQDKTVGKTFYDTRVVNGQSVEMSNEGVMKFIIGHRFGRVNSGSYNFFGLDNSTIRLGFDYAIKKWLNIGIGRNSFEKTYDGFIKIRLMEQLSAGNKRPVTMVYHASTAYRTLKPREGDIPNYTENNLFYTHQLLVGKKLTDRLSIQVMPTLIHRNLVDNTNETNDVLAAGGAFRYVVTKRFTVSSEYYYVLPNQLGTQYNNSLSLGLNLETKGHVFQFHLGNSRGMIEKYFVTETTGLWEKGDIHFGFNITRDFKLKGRKY